MKPESLRFHRIVFSVPSFVNAVMAYESNGAYPPEGRVPSFLLDKAERSFADVLTSFAARR
jgi:hypothetical protein